MGVSPQDIDLARKYVPELMHFSDEECYFLYVISELLIEDCVAKESTNHLRELAFRYSKLLSPLLLIFSGALLVVNIFYDFQILALFYIYFVVIFLMVAFYLTLLFAYFVGYYKSYKADQALSSTSTNDSIRRSEKLGLRHTAIRKLLTEGNRFTKCTNCSYNLMGVRSLIEERACCPECGATQIIELPVGTHAALRKKLLKYWSNLGHQ